MFKRGSSTENLISREEEETIIGSTTDFHGVLKSDGLVRIYGVLEGEIETAGTVVIGKSAKVIASITAQNVSVAGAVKGNITAAGRMEIFTGGKVFGNVVAAALLIEDGGIFSGQSIMRGQNAEQLFLEAHMEEAPESDSSL